MLASHAEALTQRVRETLESGQPIAVLGWIHRNHNQLTRKMEGKKLIFYNASPPSIGSNVGLVLFTKYVNHDVTLGIKEKRPTHPIALEVREIREILASCEDILCPPLPPPDEEDRPKAATTGPPHIISLEEEAYDFEVLDFITTPRRRRPMSNMEGFTKDFLEAAAKSEDGAVGKMNTTTLRKGHSIPQESRRLAREGWLEAVVREGGTKVSRYKPGKKMLELAAGPKECETLDDPYV